MYEQFHADMIKMYEAGASLREVADHFNLSATSVMRLMKKHNKLRDKKTAQTQALQSGKSIHPTHGKTRSDTTRQKISQSQADTWDSLPDTERQKRKDEAKERWDNMSPSKKIEFNRRATKGIREAAVNGSKMELYLKDILTKKGYDVVFHKKELIPNTKLEVDFLIPKLKTVIELDGPSHYKPIWGDEALQRTIKSDNQKDGLLISYGYIVVRIQYDATNFTLLSKTHITNEILQILKKIESKQLANDQQTITIKV